MSASEEPGRTEDPRQLDLPLNEPVPVSSFHDYWANHRHAARWWDAPECVEMPDDPACPMTLLDQCVCVFLIVASAMLVGLAAWFVVAQFRAVL